MVEITKVKVEDAETKIKVNSMSVVIEEVGAAAPVLQEKEIEQNGEYTADDGFDGLSKVIVDVQPQLQNKEIEIIENGNHIIAADDKFDGLGEVKVNVNIDVEPALQDKSINITENGTVQVEADKEFDGLGTVEVVVDVQGTGGSGEDTLTALFNGTLEEYENNDITEIRTYAFSTTNLKQVSFQNVKKVDNHSFDNCLSLTQANMPNLTTIGEYAFRSCTSLKKVVAISNNISQYAFYNCIKLEDFEIDGLIKVPQTRAFYNTPSLKIDVNTGSASGAIATYSFYSSGIKSLTGKGITGFGTSACELCENLSIVDIGKQATSYTAISATSFKNCSNLTTLILRNTSGAHTLSNINAFAGTPIENGTGFIYVPDELVNIYKSATNWSTYAAQIKPISELPEAM